MTFIPFARGPPTTAMKQKLNMARAAANAAKRGGGEAEAEAETEDNLMAVSSAAPTTSS
jgi:hypothetical protein